MKRAHARMLFIAAAATAGGLFGSCSDRPTDDACYFDDSENAEKYQTGIMPAGDWCEYGPNDLSPLIAEHCPSGACVQRFIMCEQVPVDYVCQRCPAEELDDMLRDGIEADNEEMCSNGPREILDFERGCMFALASQPPSEPGKSCCYAAHFVMKPCDD